MSKSIDEILQGMSGEAEGNEQAGPQDSARRILNGLAGMIFSSRHSDEKHVEFREVGESGAVESEKDEWIRLGKGLQSKKTVSMVRTASGRIVSANQLQSRCGICGGYEDAVIVSDLSGMHLCRCCAKVVTGPDGKSLTLSPREFIEFSENMNTWLAKDIQEGRKTTNGNPWLPWRSAK